MAPVRRLVLDVLKPHEPPLLAFSESLADVESVEAVTVSLVELDQEVQNVVVTAEGTALSFEALEEEVTALGGTVHSVDQAACGDRVVEHRSTPQDR